MAKKSKTQRAKASAARAERKAQAKRASEQGLDNAESVSAQAEASAEDSTEKKGLFKRSHAAASSEKAAESKQASNKEIAKQSAKDKKPGRVVTFFRDVRSEMRRVTWPSRQDVLRWSGVVVVALLFFGIYVAVLDNLIVTPLLVAVSGISGLIA